MDSGGSTPCYFDISEYLEHENRIMIQVDNTRRYDQVPALDTDWFNYGGIYRDIELIRVPQIHIKEFQIALKPDGKFHTIYGNIRLSEKVNDEAQLHIEELHICQNISIRDGYGTFSFAAAPQLWSPENPKLYDVTVSCLTDQVRDRVGFREIRVEGMDILLNGQPVFLRGISCHEESVAYGKALTDEERIENIQLAKELGCNFMRIAHYPHNERMAQLADELGMLLWEEVPVYWSIDFASEDTYQDADARLKFMGSLAQCAHKMDATRAVSAACLVNYEKNAIEDRLEGYLDIIGLNEYCGWYTADWNRFPELFENSKPQKPVIITEFGADALANEHGTYLDKSTEECQAYVYERQTALIEKTDYIKGMTPWILYDFRCPRRTSVKQLFWQNAFFFCGKIN